jgi:hypothetical protein
MIHPEPTSDQRLPIGAARHLLVKHEMPHALLDKNPCNFYLVINAYSMARLKRRAWPIAERIFERPKIFDYRSSLWIPSL